MRKSGKEKQMRIPLFQKSRRAATDPVCDMKVDTERPPGGRCQYEGKEYYFCGPGCNRVFQKEPSAYVSGEKKIKM